jgi:hypothetical protein|tara:strand:- start:921 stop:1280 length:360 start_codon:yes stop_codon:yes gene_type:complete
MKKSEFKSYIKNEIIEVLKEASPEDVANQEAYNDSLATTIALSKEAGLIEGEDDEPSSKDLNSTSKDSVAKIATKLSATDKEMKTVVNKWKKSEGAEKEEFLKRLKALTKIKKELEGLL